MFLYVHTEIMGSYNGQQEVRNIKLATFTIAMRWTAVTSEVL